MQARTGRALGATAEISPDGIALMVGLGGRLGVLCAGTVIDSGLRGVAVAHAPEAAARMAAIAPRIVIVPSTLERAERIALLVAADQVGAEFVELPAIVDDAFVGHAIARAVARTEARRASGITAI
jgi:hypothetical protein